MRVLVTGGAGFLGSHVVEVLEEAVHDVVVLDDLSSGRRERLRTGVPLVEADVRDAGVVSRVIAEFLPDSVVHLAARQFDPRDSRTAAYDVEVNVSGAIHVAAAAALANVPHFVFASSAAVYGELRGQLADEDLVTHPQSANGVAKLAVEGFLRTTLAGSIRAITVLRFANLYGSGSSSECESAVHSFVERVASGEPPHIDGDGSQTRDFVFVGDAADAVAIAVGSRPHGAFNVGTGMETSILELSTCVAEALGVAPPTPRYRPSRPNDVRRSCLDGTRLFEAVGFRPATKLRHGLAETVASRCPVTATMTGLS